MTAHLAGKPPRRSSFLRWLTPIAMAISMVACTATNSSTGPASTGGAFIDSKAAATADVTIKWYRQPYMFSSKSKLLDFWRVNNTLYMTTEDSLLLALDADSGRTNWKLDLVNMPHVFRPAEYLDYVACLNGSSGVLIDRHTGHIVQHAALPFACTTAPIVSAGALCVGSGNDFFYGLYMDLFGKVKWPVHSEVGKDSFVSQPTIIGGRRIVMASQKGHLWCVDPDFGSIVWTFRKVTGNVVGGLASDSRNVYVPSMDNKVFAFDINGEYVWDTHLEGTLDQTVISAKRGALLLVPATGKGLTCLETEKGIPQWTLPGLTLVVSLSRTHVYMATGDNNVQAVRLDTGAVDKTIPLIGVSRFATNLQSATIYAMTADGRTMAIEP